MTDQTSWCVDDGLQSVQELCGKTDQQRIAVIELCRHKTGDERHNSMTRQLPLDAPQLTQDTEHLAAVREMCVVMDALCPDKRWGLERSWRHNVVGTDTERYAGNLVHASTRRTPHHFSLCSVQLQAVASHPRRYVVDTGRNGDLKTCWTLCMAEAVHLCVVRVQYADRILSAASPRTPHYKSRTVWKLWGTSELFHLSRDVNGASICERTRIRGNFNKLSCCWDSSRITIRPLTTVDRLTRIVTQIWLM